MNEQTITADEARTILNTPGYDAYGRLRIYAVWHNQIVSIKSNYYLDRYEADAIRIYTVGNNGTVPIHRA